jgi:hypothetical protein
MLNLVLTAAAAPPEYTLTVATVVQNEADWIAEWLEFHLLPEIGVEHFFLYDDGSTDNTSLVLAPYIAARLVTYIPLASRGMRSVNTLVVDGVRWQDCGRGWLKAGTFRDSDGTCSRRAAFGQQIVAMRHAVMQHGHLTRWMAWIDVDEYVSLEPCARWGSMPRPPAPGAPHSFHELLRAADACAGCSPGERVGAFQLVDAVMMPKQLSATPGLLVESTQHALAPYARD